MPHKRNPELCERVCGLARLIRGNALTSLDNISLWHQTDISHSSNERIILPDSCLALDYILNLFTSVMSKLQVFPEQMKKNLNLTKGLIFSQRVMLELIEKGLSRQDAYKVVQRNAMKAWKGHRSFLTLLKSDADVTASISVDELEALFDEKYYIRFIDDIFKRIGLTELQWQENIVLDQSLSPRSI